MATTRTWLIGGILAVVGALLIIGGIGAGISLIAGIRARGDPKAEEILNRMANAYAKARSLQQETVNITSVTVRAGTQQRRGRGEHEGVALVERPNRIRFEWLSEGKPMPSVGRLFCNGQYLYIENPNLKQTWRMPAPSHLKDVYTVRNLRYAESASFGLDPVMLMTHGDWRRFVEAPRFLGVETIEGRQLYHIRYRVRDTSMLNPEFERPIYEHAWVGVQDSLLWRAEVTFRLVQQDAEQTMTTTVIVKKQVLNAPIPPERFEYKLPEGYQFATRQ